MLEKFMANMSQLLNKHFPHCTPVGVYIKKVKSQVGSVIKIIAFCELKALSLLLGKILWERSIVMQYISFKVFRKFS